MINISGSTAGGASSRADALLGHGATARPASIAAWPAILAGAAIWAAGVAANAPLKLDHDIAYIAAAGRIMNQGAQPYVDWIDFNTTAIYGIGRFSAWAAAFLHAPLDLTLKAVNLALALLGLAIACAVALPALRRPGPARWALAIGAPAVLMFATPEFGQREHLLCLGLLGWALSIMLAEGGVRRPWPVGLAAGALAGAALYLKPHFILFGCVLGAADLIRARWRFDRLLISTWTAAAVSIALYLWLLIANPAYLGVMLPSAVDLYRPLSAGWRLPARQLANMAPAIAALLLAALLLMRSGVRRPPVSAFIILGGFAAAAALSHVQQSLGFAYQRLPFDIALSLSALGLLAWGLDRTDRDPQRLAGLAAAGFVLVATLTSQGAAILNYPRRETISQLPLVEALRPPNPEDAILILTTDNHPAAEILTLIDARWAGAFLNLYPLPALVMPDGKALSREQQDRWEPWFRAKVAERFCARPPVRVAVDVSKTRVFLQDSDIDMLAWLRRDPTFDACWRAARLSPVERTIISDARAHDYVFDVYAPR